MSEYSAEGIVVREFDDSVRRSPGMYLQYGPPGEFRVPARVLNSVLIASLHPATRTAPDSPPHVSAQITGPLRFSITDNLADHRDDAGGGYFGSLLTPSRWVHAAAAVLCTRTTVEIRHDGRGLRQELAGLRPAGPPTVFAAEPGTGMTLVYELDPEFFGAATLPHDISGFVLHENGCCATPGSLSLRSGKGVHQR